MLSFSFHSESIHLRQSLKSSLKQNSAPETDVMDHTKLSLKFRC